MFTTKTLINLAIIIPTLNEEHFIGRLLDSIIKQSVMPKELVIVDAYSKDKTIAEIKKRQGRLPILHYFRIRKSTISRQRNLGTKKTTSPHLLFLDADMELREKDVLRKYFQEVLEKKADVATARNLPDNNTFKNSLYFKGENLLIQLSKYFWPIIAARNLYVRRKVFNQVGGFDEAIAVAEDQELVHRIIKDGGKLSFLKSVKLHTSTRRVEWEGRRKYALKMFLFGLNILLRGHKKASIEYEFGGFKKPENLH